MLDLKNPLAVCPSVGGQVVAFCHSTHREYHTLQFTTTTSSSKHVMCWALHRNRGVHRANRGWARRDSSVVVYASNSIKAFPECSCMVCNRDWKAIVLQVGIDLSRPAGRTMLSCFSLRHLVDDDFWRCKQSVNK